jgi:hypothetical protein
LAFSYVRKHKIAIGPLFFQPLTTVFCSATEEPAGHEKHRKKEENSPYGNYGINQAPSRSLDSISMPKRCIAEE